MVPQEVKDAIAKILAACRKANKKCGIFAVDGQEGRQFAEQGFDMICVATDYMTLDAALKDSFKIAKGGVKQPS